MGRFIVLIGLLFLTTTLPAQISSTFDADIDGWTASDNQTGPAPAYLTSNGNPGGFIQVVDGVAGTATYFNAPAKFLGDKSDYYRGTLHFDLQVDVTPNSSTAGVRLTGGGLVLVKLLPELPAVSPGWTSYSFALDETEGWRLTSTTGNFATAADIEVVLTSLTALQINGEYSTAASDAGGLDNVLLEPGQPDVEPDLIIYNALSPNNDGLNDSWIIENILSSETRENNVKISNRWGDLVWEGTNYDNHTVLFIGNDNNGNKLLTGTYFYVIEFKSGRNVESGFISLRR